MTELVNNGVELSNQASRSFKNILSGIKRSTDYMDSIATATKEQNVGANEINISISSVVNSAEKIKDMADLQMQNSLDVTNKVTKIVTSAEEITNATENQNLAVNSIAQAVKSLKDSIQTTVEAIDSPPRLMTASASGSTAI